MADDGLKDWTVMVYMAGDNNLGVDMSYALNQINKAALQNKRFSNANFLAYYDGNTPDVPTLYCDFSDCENIEYFPATSYKIPNLDNDKKLTIREKLKAITESSEFVEMIVSAKPQGGENSAKVTSLIKFVHWCLNAKSRRAKNYALILSGHGFGFQSLTLLKDNSSNFYMTLRMLRWGLEEVNKIIGRDKIEILGFDSCVMSMLEVGYELKDVAQTMIASEGTIPNAGWSYEPILEAIAKRDIKKDNYVFSICKDVVRSFIQTQEKFAVGGVSVDLSAWDLTKVEAIVTSVNQLGEILLKGLQNESIRQLLDLVLLKSHYKSQSFMFEQNVDLIDFCEILIEESNIFNSETQINLALLDIEEKSYLFKDTLKLICDDVISKVKECIQLNGYSGGRFQYANGISIFFPWTYLVFLLSMGTYDFLRFVYFNKGVYWREFLFQYLSETSLRGRNDQFNFVITEMESKTTENPKTRTTENPKTRLVEDFAGIRTIENPATRTTENPRTRVIENPATRTTENPRTRLLDGSIPFLYDFKNVAMPWFVAGLNNPHKKSSDDEPNETETTD